MEYIARAGLPNRPKGDRLSVAEIVERGATVNESVAEPVLECPLLGLRGVEPHLVGANRHGVIVL